MADEITPMEQAIVAAIKGLVGPDTKPLFNVVESYNAVLEGKSPEELKAELERRGDHCAFVFNTHLTLSKLARVRGQPRHKLMEFIVLVCASNLNMEGSTRMGSPGSVGSYYLVCAVSDLIDGVPISNMLPIPILYMTDAFALMTTQDFSIYALTFGPKPPQPHERP